MFGLGMGELVLIFLIALIFIGPKKLPELAKGLGQGLKEFQKATKGFSEQLDQAKQQITQEIHGSGREGQVEAKEEFPMHSSHYADAQNTDVKQDAKPKDPSSHS